MSKFNRDYIITMDDIVREGEPILRVVTEPVSVPPTEEDREEMAAMLQFLKNSQDPEISKKYKLRAGVGLSANQIGLNKRMFAALLTDENGKDRPLAMYNPKIISHSQAMTYLPEAKAAYRWTAWCRGSFHAMRRFRSKPAMRRAMRSNCVLKALTPS